jgi:tRNA nucleotidyltransferase (CCA-adding enzyme)
MIHVLESIRKTLPSKKEEEAIGKKVDAFVRELERRIAREGIDAEVFVGGAWAKGTWLRGTDIDVFLRFRKEKDIGMVPRILKGLKYATIHGSRDYFQVGMFEIVPILKISKPEQAKNVTDISPFHVDYVKKNLKSKDDVRLLKLFCKSAGVYGAESHVEGFSGYSLELLMVKYGSFSKLIASAEKWKPKVEIDFGRKGKLSEQKTKSPIIIHDPTFLERNAAAGLGYETFSRFLLRAREFFRKPGKEFFVEEKMTRKNLVSRSIRRGTKIFTKPVPIQGTRDVFLSKLRRDLRRIRSRMESLGFSVYDSGFLDTGRKALIFFEFETWKTSSRRTHFGPPVWVDGKHFDDFVHKWKKVYAKDNRLAVDVLRDSDAIRTLKKTMREYSL